MRKVLSLAFVVLVLTVGLKSQAQDQISPELMHEVSDYRSEVKAGRLRNAFIKSINDWYTGKVDLKFRIVTLDRQCHAVDGTDFYTPEEIKHAQLLLHQVGIDTQIVIDQKDSKTTVSFLFPRLAN